MKIYQIMIVGDPYEPAFPVSDDVYMSEETAKKEMHHLGCTRYKYELEHDQLWVTEREVK